MAHGPKVGRGAGQSSAWAKALTNNVMVLTSTRSAGVMNEGTNIYNNARKRKRRKGRLNAKTYQEKAS